jgi:hypothetical protein
MGALKNTKPEEVNWLRHWCDRATKAEAELAKLRAQLAMAGKVELTVCVADEGNGEFLCSVQGEGAHRDAWATTQGTAVKAAMVKWLRAYEVQHGKGEIIADDE